MCQGFKDLSGGLLTFFGEEKSNWPPFAFSRVQTFTFQALLETVCGLVKWLQYHSISSSWLRVRESAQHAWSMTAFLCITANFNARVASLSRQHKQYWFGLQPPQKEKDQNLVDLQPMMMARSCLSARSEHDSCVTCEGEVWIGLLVIVLAGWCRRMEAATSAPWIIRLTAPLSVR